MQIFIGSVFVCFVYSIRITDRGEMIVGDNPRPVEAVAPLVSPPDNQFLSPQKLVRKF